MTRFHSHPITRRVRSIAFLLLLSYLLPFAQMAYAASSDPEAALPACCRTHGKHKCSMHMPLQAQGDDGKHATVSPAQIRRKMPLRPGEPDRFGYAAFRASSHRKPSASLIVPNRSALLRVVTTSMSRQSCPPEAWSSSLQFLRLSS